MLTLTDKKAVVTGAARGIGKEIATSLAMAGADVGICDVDLSSAQQCADDIASRSGRRTWAYQCDVSNAEAVAALFDQVTQRFDGLDILVNNAGITRDTLMMRMKEEDWDSVIAVNLKSAYLCSKEAARLMVKARAGRIVNIASVIGLMGNAGQANYAASKGGMIALTKSLAKELGPRGITVNAVAPGFITSAMTDTLSDKVKNAILEQIPLKEFGSAQDIAHTVAFLASGLAGYITGEVIRIDGGLAM
jgi:3-oxoacyl-[acyl-carrier protein] reductase